MQGPLARTFLARARGLGSARGDPGERRDLVRASTAAWPKSADAVADLVVASHMRALMAPQPTDVGSSDRHTVKPWFNGRVPEAPRVIDLGNEGFPLVGGRIDVIGRIPVPTLVYRHRQHLISLIAVPEARRWQRRPRDAPIAGYNVLTWTQNGTVYWAVSDLAASRSRNLRQGFPRRRSVQLR